MGGDHLLFHKIWAFKSYAAGERTDLILKESTSPNNPICTKAEGLVLTEWKTATQTDCDAKIAQAKKQAHCYGKGSLHPLELASTRYIVIVSEKELSIELSQSELEGITYKVINIAYNPNTPSGAPRKEITA